MVSFADMLKQTQTKAQPEPPPVPAPAPAPAPSPLPFAPQPKPAPAPSALPVSQPVPQAPLPTPTVAPAPAASPTDSDALLASLASTTSESVRQATLSPGELRLSELASLGHDDRVLSFVRTLQSIPLLSESNDLDSLRNAMRIVWAELAQNPALQEHVRPQDFGAVIRALRTSMGVAAVQVKEKKERRTKSAASGNAIDNVFAKSLSGLDF